MRCSLVLRRSVKTPLELLKDRLKAPPKGSEGFGREFGKQGASEEAKVHVAESVAPPRWPFVLASVCGLIGASVGTALEQDDLPAKLAKEVQGGPQAPYAMGLVAQITKMRGMIQLQWRDLSGWLSLSVFTPNPQCSS